VISPARHVIKTVVSRPLWFACPTGIKAILPRRVRENIALFTTRNATKFKLAQARCVSLHCCWDLLRIQLNIGIKKRELSQELENEHNGVGG
jgi:hypothetical protein